MKVIRIIGISVTVLMLVAISLGCSQAQPTPTPPPPGIQYKISPDAQLVSFKWYGASESKGELWFSADVEVQNTSAAARNFDVGVKAGDAPEYFDGKEIKAGAKAIFQVQSALSTVYPDKLFIEIK